MASLKNVQHPVSVLDIIAKIPIPGSPDWMAIDSNAVWTSNGARNSIARIDPASNRLVATVPVGGSPCSGLAAGFGSIWAPSCQVQRVERIDASTNSVTARVQTGVADSEGGIAAGAGSVWIMTDQNGTLARIDPTTNTVLRTINMDSASFALTATDDAVWVTSSGHNRLIRVDPRTNQVSAHIDVGPSPRFLCVTEDSVWVLNQGDGTVTRVDSESHQVVSTIKVGKAGPGGDIAFGEGAVWVTMVNVPLTKIDPATNRVTHQFVGPGGDAIRSGFGSLWLCSFFLQEMWRVKAPI